MMVREPRRRIAKQAARDIVTGARRRRDETLAQVADALGVSTATLSRKLNDRYEEGLTEAEIERLAARRDLERRECGMLRQCFG